MSAYAVVYDACVLYPAPVRDLLVQLATANLFRAHWTDAIHEEWIGNVLKNRPDLTRQQMERTRALMDSAVMDCLVSGYEYLIPVAHLPDADDRHILAAAIHAKADAVVTYNLRDFPSDILAKHDLEAIHPDDFINFQIDLNESAVVMAAQRCRARLKSPPRTAAEYLDTLAALQLPKSTRHLSEWASII